MENVRLDRLDASSQLAHLHVRNIKFTHVLHAGPAALHTDSSASGVSEVARQI